MEFRRIKDEHRSTGKRDKKPPFSVRFTFWLKQFKEQQVTVKRRRTSKSHVPSLSNRIRRSYQKTREKYSIVFSSKYLIITLNSTVLFLVSYMLIHFLTHVVTGISAWFCDISTTLNYTYVDFHIRYWNWTEEMVIIVFTIPAFFALTIALLSTIPFAKRLRWRSMFRRGWNITRKQRRRHRHKQRQKNLELQVHRLHTNEQPVERRKYKKRLSWTTRMFLLWTLYHSITYFFSGLLYAFIFHRRFGYVIWYAFNTFFFDLLFAAVALIALIIIGYVFSVQFFYSGRLYFNVLNDRNRLPFVLSQAIFPFIIGTIITIAMQIPVFDPTLVLLNFSLFFLLLPLPSRAVRFDSIHFDKREKTTKIFWRWIVWSSLIILSIYVAVKIGIPINV